MPRPKAAKPRGMLKNRDVYQNISHSRILPSPDLSFFIEHFWIIKWDLRNQKSVQAEVLPHPSIHLVFEKGKTRLAGIERGKFTRILEGKGGVFGVKFKPGAFYPFVKTPISGFTGKTIIPWDILGISAKDGEELEAAILSQDDDEKAIDIAESFIRARLPEPDENVAKIDRIMKRIVNDQTIIKVDDIAAIFDLSKRELQRLFSKYVGVNPKWVIKRFRLLEAVEQLANAEPPDLTKLAHDLGYFDQAHFIKDFKNFVGKPPAKYARNAR